MTENIPIVDIASKGVVKDTPPVSLTPNIFTDVRNVRFKDGAVRKIEGELLLNSITSDLSNPQSFGKVRYFASWENPNKQPTGCYYIFVVDLLNNNITIGQKVYIQDHLGTKKDITPTSLNSGNGFAYTATGWQHTLFAGGFSLIINNGRPSKSKGLASPIFGTELATPITVHFSSNIFFLSIFVYSSLV